MFLSPGKVSVYSKSHKIKLQILTKSMNVSKNILKKEQCLVLKDVDLLVTARKVVSFFLQFPFLHISIVKFFKTK